MGVDVAGSRDLKGRSAIRGWNSAYKQVCQYWSNQSEQRRREKCDAGTNLHLLASVTPESGVIGSCTSLMVTVPLDGFVHSSVNDWPAVTSKVDAPAGTLMAFCCADTTAAQRAATAANEKRMLMRCNVQRKQVVFNRFPQRWRDNG